MTKKRKSVATSLDEVDRSVYSTFCSAANSLSQLYTLAMSQQKLSFQAGERHGLEKLYQWVLRQQDGGSRVPAVDLLNYLENELEHISVEGSMSPRAPAQPPPVHPTLFANSGSLVSSDGVEAFNHQGFRSEPSDQQPKSSVFSNALSSPVRRSLQNNDISSSPSDYFINNVQPSETGIRNDPHRSIQHQSNSSDSMDMHG